jgi:hypothetical protein
LEPLILLTYCRHRTPEQAPVPGWAAIATELPELDGARITVLDLHNGQPGQFLHLLASGVTPEYTWPYGTIANRMPILWLRDRNGRWHTARPARSSPLRDTDDYILWLRVVPPLDDRTPSIDLMAARPSVEFRARLDCCSEAVRRFLTALVAQREAPALNLKAAHREHPAQ